MASDPSSEPPDLRFFDGLAWAVPTAFAGALAGFRFEQGDVLHRMPEAYEGGPPPADEAGAVALQVLAPPRSARATAGDAEGDRRRTSFESEVELEVVDLRAGSRRALTTTQGRLLMTLWRGDLDWLEGAHEAPPVPLGARSLAGELEALRAGFEAALAAPAGTIFLFVVDLASDAARVKAESIREALAFVENATWLDRTPLELGLASADAYHPALVVRGVSLPAIDEARVTEALRTALYGGKAAGDDPPTASGDAEDDKPADRFSVARHGLLGTVEG